MIVSFDLTQEELNSLFRIKTFLRLIEEKDSFGTIYHSKPDGKPDRSTGIESNVHAAKLGLRFNDVLEKIEENITAQKRVDERSSNNTKTK